VSKRLFLFKCCKTLFFSVLIKAVFLSAEKSQIHKNISAGKEEPFMRSRVEKTTEGRSRAASNGLKNIRGYLDLEEINAICIIKKRLKSLIVRNVRLFDSTLINFFPE
jgi:hypothetical protein